MPSPAHIPQSHSCSPLQPGQPCANAFGRNTSPAYAQMKREEAMKHVQKHQARPETKAALDHRLSVREAADKRIVVTRKDERNSPPAEHPRPPQAPKSTGKINDHPSFSMVLQMMNRLGNSGTGELAKKLESDGAASHFKAAKAAAGATGAVGAKSHWSAIAR
jgi:hypothetical protein